MNVYSNTSDELVPDGLCEVYEYEVDARNSTLVEVHIRTLTPQEMSHLTAIGKDCKPSPDKQQAAEAMQKSVQIASEGPALTKAQVQTIADQYLSRGVANYDAIQDQFTYDALTGKYAAHEWSWKDASYTSPSGITIEPFPYPLIRIQMAADGTLAFYGNTVSLFK